MTLLAALLYDRQGPTPTAAPVETTAGATAPATPPDLSQMTPREQFDRLFNRIMTSAEAGDSAAVRQFSPMAIAAYQNLGAADADARYHAAMIRLATGDAPAASLLADTILAANPRHLLGLAIRGEVARVTGKPALRAASQRELLAAWDQEQAAGREEYRDHKVILDRFHDEAIRASGRQAP